MSILKSSFYVALFGAALLAATAQTISVQPKNIDELKRSIRHVIDTAGGKIGIGILEINGRNQWSLNAAVHYPMQSVYKFQLALVVLNKVDHGELALDKIIRIPENKLEKNTWSPLVKKFPQQDIAISVGDLLNYTISKSDNNTCDILFELVGGTRKVDQFIRGLGIKNMSIKTTEAQMRLGWQVQYTNWTTPDAMVQLLSHFYNEKILSPKSTAYLMQLMTDTENSPKRIKGLLAANALLAHKTGTSNTNAAGVTAATNDVGILTLPNGKKLAIAVFVSDYKGGVAKGEQVIAAIAKMIWDYYSK